MPKPKTKKKPKLTGKLAGKKVAIVGKFGTGSWDKDRVVEMIKLEGGTVVNGEKKKPDLLVEGKGQGKSAPGASTRIQKKYPGLQVLDEADLYTLLTPTADELDAILRNCPHDWSYWYSMSYRLGRATSKPDLSGRSFRNLNLKTASLDAVKIDHCDFRGANLDGVDLGKVRGANFDGAKLSQLNEAEDCTFRNADLQDCYPDDFKRCDFTGANLKDWYGSYLNALDCTFAKANLAGTDLSDSTFKKCDFTRADLSDADLSESQFTDCDFTGANLARATLVEAMLKNANLTNADLREAVLTDVVLTGAILDGADFAGANLAGVNLKGVDVSKAKNLDVRPPRPIGPNLKKLANVVKQSKKFTTRIELTLGKKENVILEMQKSMSGRKSYFSADFDHNTPANKRSTFANIDAPSFEQGMINLAERWFRGTPKFETVTIKATRCPKKGVELEQLVHAAWCEALGLPVPTADDIKKQQEASAAKRDAVRDKLLEELRGGAAGIKKWNKREQHEQAKLGALAGLDFSNAKMGGVELGRWDCRGTKFDGASLSKAHLWDAQLQGASFAGATLSNARLGYAKCQAASFEGASMIRTEAYNANFQGANLRNATLKHTNLSDANLCGADFTGATLEKVDFDRAKFDNDTKFPAGFELPKKLVWKGTGSRPGLTAVKAAAAGSMDFDSFFKNLDAQVERARMQKARSMLKAEKFQLFADVTDEKLVGVVKSQTNRDLVYSCRLASDGQFCCGTQNLKPCGGLQGALCKHLLVLIVGLAKAGKADPATVYGWVCASAGHQPVLDKDGMSETFLKYKGAEAGEIDWRPTETIPEDYYAM